MNSHVTVTLTGTESIAHSAATIRDAARMMQAAAEQISFALERHQQFMDEWLQRFENTLTETK